MDSDPRSRPGYNPFPSTNRQRESRREGKDSKGYVDPNVAHPLDHRLGAGYAWANMAGYKRLNSEWSSPDLRLVPRRFLRSLILAKTLLTVDLARVVAIPWLSGGHPVLAYPLRQVALLHSTESLL